MNEIQLVTTGRGIEDTFKQCPKCKMRYDQIEMVCQNDGYILVSSVLSIIRPNLQLECETVLDNRFTIKYWIGEGNLTQAYGAEDKETGSNCAVKVLRREYQRDGKTVRRFLSEAQRNKSLSHRYIAETHAHGVFSDQSGEQPWFAMDMLIGEDLATRLKKTRTIKLVPALNMCIALSEALEYAHGFGITHKHVQPSNIFLLDDGTVRLTDFGLAERQLKELQWNTLEALTASGNLYGEPAYMDPAYAKSGKATPASDIYSLGCILHECITGSPPFTGDNELQVLFAHIDNSPEPVSNRRPELKASGIDYVILKCLEKDPWQRFRTASDLRDALMTVEP